MRQGAGVLVGERRKSLPRPVRTFRRSPSDATPGLQLHHWDCRRRVASTAESRCAATPMIGIWWKPSLKWLSAKFRAVLAGLTAAP